MKMDLLKIGKLMKKYFIDCGAHCGESILMAKQRFGLDTTTISFEPVPYLAEQLVEIHKNDSSVYIQNSAVWIEDTVKRFYISDKYTDGSSLLNSLNDLKDEQYIDMNCFDFSAWLKNTFSKDDYVILKLDIEGAEYEVLNKMIEDKTIDLVNEFWGEWHDMKIKDDHTHVLAQKVYSYLRNNNIEFREWEIHIPTYGKNHPLLAFRPHKLTE